MKRSATSSEGIPTWLFLSSIFAFFASGFSALVYQVAWQRMLAVFAGSDVLSATLVIGAFLAGLGAGSLAAAALADRFSPAMAMRIFALSNLAIAIYGFFSKFLLYNVLVSPRTSWIPNHPAVSFGVVLLGLFLPTFLMGTSLPFISKALVQSVKSAAAKIGILYGFNTLGSVAGALSGGWYLIPRLGYEETVLVASRINLLVSVVALLISFSLLNTARKNATSQRTTPLALAPEIRLWLILALLGGFIAISLEIVWFRFLGVMLNTTFYSFSHLLAFVLIGYGLGSLLASSYSMKFGSPRTLYVRLFLLATLYSILSLLAAGQLSALYNDLIAKEAILGNTRWLLDFIIIPSLLLLPPNLLIGYSFVVLQQGIQKDTKQIAARIGYLQVSSTIGNVLGSILTGLVLLHLLGFIGTLIVIIITALMMAWIDWPHSAKTQHKLSKNILLAGGLLVITLLLPSNLNFWQGVHEYKTPNLEIAYLAEDSTGVSALLDDEKKTLVVNAEVQGWFEYAPDSVHSYLGILGTLIHLDPKDVYIIGIGSGNTPVAAGFNPNTESITAVEIVGSEIPILEFVRNQNASHPVNILFEDPRYTLVVGDGRSILRESTQQFDVIEADAIRPYKSGSGFLYSVEFFRTARNQLKPGGFMVQWPATERVRETFLLAFPYVVELPGKVMIGSASPINIDSEQINERLSEGLVTNGYFDENEILTLLNSALQELTSFNLINPADIGDFNTDLYPKDELGLRFPHN